MDTTELRTKLHAAVDELLDQFASRENGSSPTSAVSGVSERIERIGPVEPFVYNWPADYGSEDFDSGAAYRLPMLPPGASVVVAWTTRKAWGRNRRRAVVFYRARHDDGPGRWYPWTEFVETDTDGYAASIPNPQRPRAIMRDPSALPAHFAGATVARSDELFDPIRDGASLRLVLPATSEDEMVRHGYWVATLRGRI